MAIRGGRRHLENSARPQRVGAASAEWIRASREAHCASLIPREAFNVVKKEAVMTSRASRAVGAVVVATLVVSVSGPTLEAQAPAGKAALMNPAEFNEQAPATFQARFETSAGPFVIEVHRDWAPNGADRFYNLVKRGFYDGCRFYRIISGLAQFGINGDPEVAQAWFTARIPDDQRTQSNLKGTIAYSSAGINRRSTQVFINLIDNPGMDVFNAPHGFAPFGRVLSGMNVVESLYNGYGETAPTGKGPQMTPLYSEGNAYLEKEFPKMDYIKTASIVS